MLFKTTDNLSLYYEVTGNTQSLKTIVFLNGLSQSTLAWFFMLPHFKETHKIILVDFVFQGQSSKEAEWRTFDQHAQDIKELLDSLKIEKPIIAGLSYGSLVAQHFALLYPQKLSKLILMSTFAHKTPYYNAIETAWWNALQIGGYPLMLDVMLPSVLGENYFKNPLIPIDLLKQTRADSNIDSTSLFKLMRATKERPDYRPMLKNITTPTLIIHGEKDLLLSVHLAEEVHKAIPNSVLQIIPGVGHTLNLEAVAQTAQLILNF
jgi:3-oxoadipate enol-lactonase